MLRFLIDPRGFEVPTWPFFYFVVLGYCYMVLYLTLGWATAGRSVGSRILGLRVVGRKGPSSPGPSRSSAPRSAPSCPVALFWCVVSRENRSVQDILLRTSVIHDWPVPSEVRVTDVDSRSDL